MNIEQRDNHPKPLSTRLQRYKTRRPGGLALLAGLLLGGCAGEGAPPDNPLWDTPDMLAPAGPAAEVIAGLWWLLFSMAAVVFVVVLALFVYALFRRRGSEPEEVKEANPRLDRLLIVVGGITIPALILAVVFIATVRGLGALAAPDIPEERVIEVVGRQWWWEVHYPSYQFTTANEIHIPVGVPVQLRLTSADVIHSFWVPELHGKLDLMPNDINFLSLQAGEPGIYYGQCAEFCGLQHAKMGLIVVAQPMEEYLLWLEQQQQPAAEVSEEELLAGQRVFLSSDCGECHTIRGTDATGILGPDLTHLASRLTLAAGVLENNRGNLGGWISNPQSIKPGNKMPAVDLTGPQLQSLLVYLESLE